MASAHDPTMTSEPRRGARNRQWLSDRLSDVVALSTAALIFIGTFPAQFNALRIGVDESWIYAINHLPGSGFLFGRDIVFTYGPLGYLLYPLDHSSNLNQAAVLWVIHQSLLVGLMAYFYLQHRGIYGVIGFAVAYLFALGLGFLFEYRLLLLLVLLLAVHPTNALVWRSASLIAGILAGVLLFVKLNIGLAAFLALGLGAAGWAYLRVVPPRQILTWLALPYFSTLALLSLPLLDGTNNFVRWISRGSEILSGYSSSMALPLPSGVVPFAVLGITLLALTMVSIGRMDRAAVFSLLPLTAVVFVAFKHAFTRAEGRPFFGVLVGALAVVLLRAPSRKAFAYAMVAAAFFVPFAIAGAHGRLDTGWISGFNPRPGWSGIVSLANLGKVRADLAAASYQNLQNDRLPDAVTARIQAVHGDVDSIPVSLTFMEANGLRWKPNPLLQTYHGFTAELDRWTASHFLEEEAPDFLLYQWADIDARHPLLGQPAMWRSILANYGLSVPPHTFGTFGEIALLERRGAPVPLALRVVGRDRVGIGDWIEPPESPDLLFASIRFSPTILGRLSVLLWRIEPVEIDLQYADGRNLTFRILPETSENGLLMNYLPSSMYELLNLFQGIRPSPVVRFRVRGPGTSSFQRTLDIVWRSAPWIPPPSTPVHIGAIPP